MLTQIAAVSLMNLRNVPARAGMSSVVVAGVAGVVAVLISVLSMHQGFEDTIAKSARADRAIVLSQGAETESEGAISQEAMRAIGDAPGVKKGADGRPIISAETLVFAAVARKSDGINAYVTLRGVGPEAFQLRPEVKLVSGRMYRAGLHELIVGQAAQTQFAGLQIGSRIPLNQGDWTVVGVFESDGSAYASQMMGDATSLMSAYGRHQFHSVTALLESERAFPAFRDALATNAAAKLSPMTELAYFSGLAGPLQRFLRLVAWVIGSMLAVGALFGALNTMYFAVVARSVEISTLRAIGFDTAAVATSVLLEAMLLALAGALIGATAAYVLFNGNSMSTVSGVLGSSQIVYPMLIKPSLIMLAILLACALGIVGAIYPAVRACRLSMSSSAGTRMRVAT